VLLVFFVSARQAADGREQNIMSLKAGDFKRLDIFRLVYFDYCEGNNNNNNNNNKDARTHTKKKKKDGWDVCIKQQRSSRMKRGEEALNKVGT